MFDLFTIFGVRFICRTFRFGSVKMSIPYFRRKSKSSIWRISNFATQGQNVELFGDDNNNNQSLINDYIKIKDPPASFRSFVWKYFRFKIQNVNGIEITDKERTVCKICFSDVSYKTGNISNMFTHLSRKHAITSTKQTSREKN